jgi:anti-sigma regulatory factor (Ser/Thr protein kinase)
MATSTQPKEAKGDDVGARRRTPADIDCDLDRIPAKTLRQLVRQLLQGSMDGPAEDAILVTDELASNAVRHGEAPRHCRLWLFNRGRGLRIEVDDSGPEQPRQIPPDSAGGRGLLLVDRLASRWGVQRHSQRKTVWAEVDLDDRSDSSQVLNLTSPTWPPSA